MHSISCYMHGKAPPPPAKLKPISDPFWLPGVACSVSMKGNSAQRWMYWRIDLPHQLNESINCFSKTSVNYESLNHIKQSSLNMYIHKHSTSTCYQRASSIVPQPGSSVRQQWSRKSTTQHQNGIPSNFGIGFPRGELLFLFDVDSMRDSLNHVSLTLWLGWMIDKSTDIIHCVVLFKRP